MDGLSDFTCDCEGKLRDFKNQTGLQRHLHTASHKRKVLDSSANNSDFTCSCQGKMRDYKSRKLLQQHNETSFHKRKVDPVFAESELAAKKEKKALDAADPVKIAAIAAAKAGKKALIAADPFKAAAKAAKAEKRTLDAANPAKVAAKAAAKAEASKMRLAARNAQQALDQVDPIKIAAKMDLVAKKKLDDAGRVRGGVKGAKARATAKAKENQRKYYSNIVVTDPHSFITENLGTEEDVLQDLQRYHGSSAAAMQLDLDNDNKTKNKISRFINVSVATKAAIRKAWQEGPMASNAPFPACASCGIRDHTEDYAEVEIRALPNYFAFNEKDQAKFDLLKGRKLIKASARFYVTDYAL